MSPLEWSDQRQIEPRSYDCGYCGHTVGPDKGWLTRNTYIFMNQAHPSGRVFLCSYCGQPTYFDDRGRQYPGAAFGNPVLHLPEDVEALYDEARSSMRLNGYTGAVLLCRKLLMHLAVEMGAEQNQKFIQYVEFLAEKGAVPPKGRGWVDKIRTKSNEANHEIIIMSEQDAKDLLSFSEMLLKFNYEFPAMIGKPEPNRPSQS